MGANTRIRKYVAVDRVVVLPVVPILPLRLSMLVLVDSDTFGDAGADELCVASFIVAVVVWVRCVACDESSDKIDILEDGSFVTTTFLKDFVSIICRGNIIILSLSIVRLLLKDVFDEIVVVAASCRFRGGRCRCGRFVVAMDNRDVDSVAAAFVKRDEDIVPE